VWTCPKCGARHVTPNAWHSCGDHSVEEFLAGRDRALFDQFERLVARCGPYSLAPAKTRVAFMAQVRFASVNRVGEDFIDVHFVLPRKLASERFRRIEKLGKLYVHHLRLSARADFDRELQSWLRESYRSYGLREWIPGAAVRPRPRSARR
jgi:hypothetical protein